LDEMAAGPRRPALALGALCLNYELRSLELDGRSVQLTPRGLKLLDYLMRWPERVVQIPELAEVLNVDDPGGSAVRTLVWRVRQQLSEIGALPYLQTYGRTWSGGSGYWMSDPARGLGGKTS
jgi:DNA-binding response OmpR family regulator